MSLDNRFSRYGFPSDEWNETIHIYQRRPDKLTSTKDVTYRDSNAESQIKELEAALADLKEYRRRLAARYAELVTMAYRLKVKLEREPSRGYGVKYYLTVTRIYEDGTEELESSRRFAGTERREAIKEYETLCKQHRGAEHIKDIERRSWEK